LPWHLALGPPSLGTCPAGPPLRQVGVLNLHLDVLEVSDLRRIQAPCPASIPCEQSTEFGWGRGWGGGGGLRVLAFTLGFQFHKATVEKQGFSDPALASNCNFICADDVMCNFYATSVQHHQGNYTMDNHVEMLATIAHPAIDLHKLTFHSLPSLPPPHTHTQPTHTSTPANYHNIVSVMAFPQARQRHTRVFTAL